MFTEAREHRNRGITGRTRGISAPAVVVAAAVFAIALAAPVTIDLGGGSLASVSLKSALARNGGGNGGGGNGGGGNGGGNAGGNGGGNGKGTAGSETDVENGGNPVWRAFLNSGPKVTRAVFTTQIRDRSPQDDIKALDDPDRYVSFFTDLRKMDGMHVTHRWIYRDAVKYSMSFSVMSDSWQAWSTQRLPADSPGEWTVEVIDDQGKVLATERLMYMTASVDRSAGEDTGAGGFSGAVDTIKGLLNL